MTTHLRSRLLVEAKPLGFWLMPAIPFLGLWGQAIGVPGLAPLTVFVAVPLLDLVLGEDPTNRETARRWAPPWLFDAVPFAYVAAWLTAILLTAQKLSQGETDVLQTADLIIAAGIGSGFATSAAHELLHRRGPLSQFVASLTMSFVAYGGFIREHLHHHAKCGIEAAGTVPRLREGLWHFIGRNIVFSHVNGWRVSAAIARGQGRGIHRVLLLHAGSVLFLASFYRAFGSIGVLLFVSQALIAWITVELVQYFEHYALVRNPGEPVSAQHAWNSNGWMTNAITLNITRHSHHHCSAAVPYHDLHCVDGAPTFRLGYFGLVWFAVVPAIWRRTNRALVAPAPSGTQPAPGRGTHDRP